MELFFFAILSLSILTGFGPFARSDDEAEEDDTPSDPPVDPVGMTFFLQDGVPNPVGTAGNDTFTGIGQGDIFGGAGDDLFSFENGYGADVYGGDGNDTMTSGESFSLYGGAGDDSLFAYPESEGSSAYGGDGDDTLTAFIDDSPYTVTASLAGGDGEDVFALTFETDPEHGSGPAGSATITDFTPGVDTLRIEIDNFARAELADMFDGSGTELRLYQYRAPDDDSAERYATVRLLGLFNVTLDDLGLRLPEAAA